MVALSADRQLSRFGHGPIATNLELPMGASAVVYRGSLVMLDLSGYAFAATAVLGRHVVGVATEKRTNTAVAGATTLRVERGAFGFVNSSGNDAIAGADIGAPAYVVDDQTVSRTSANGARPFAGRIVRIEGSCVFVEVGGSEDPNTADILLVTSADLSADQYKLVGINSSAQIAVASAAGQDVVGILQNAPASGAIGIVRVFGPSRAIAGGAVNPGALIACTAAGKTKSAVAATTNTSDAGAASDPLVGSFVIGRSLTLGALDAQHSVFVSPIGAIPTTAA